MPPGEGLSVEDVVLDEEESQLAASLATELDTPEGAVPVPAPAADDAPPADAAPTPAEQVPAETPPQGQVPPVPASPVVPPPTWSFKADGREVTVPGAKVTADGILIPKDAWQRTVQPHLADRAAWNAQVQEFRRTEAGLREQVEAVEKGQHPAIVRANAVTAKFTELMDKGPEAVAEWLDNFQQNRPILEANARAAAAEAEREQYKSRISQADQERQQAALEPQKRTAVEQQVTALLASADYKDLGLDSQRIVQRLLKDPRTYVTADRDYPEFGLRRGELAVDVARVQEEISDLAEQARTWQAQKAATAANSRAAAPVPVPPATPVRGSPTPGGKTTTPSKVWADLREEILDL
jgi:hypothetical protein